MKEIIIKHILAWLVGLTAEQWKAAVSRVLAIAHIPGLDGNMKQAKFAIFWEKIASDMPVWAINLVRETAVAYARKRGLMK